VDVVSLYDVDIKGGCQGCLRCGTAYRCVFTGKDGFMEFYDAVVRQADILVFAGTITARQLSWKWRQFFDRSFFNTHTPSLTGKQFAFVVAGPLSQLPEMRTVYQAWTEFQRSNLEGFVSDECGDARLIASQLDTLAERLVRLSLQEYIRPRTFLGIAGDKVFRDDIWGGLRLVFPADHRAYRRIGVYDFPQKKLGRRLLVALGALVLAIPLIRVRFQASMKSFMLRPYGKVLRKAEARTIGTANTL
jgi:hypothetical protein